MTRAVLCVDDYSPGLHAMCRVLEHAGFVVSGTTESTNVVDLVEKTHFDAVVLDFQMPETNGVDLARILKQHHPRLPILLISAYPADVPKDSVNWVDFFVRKGHQTALELPAAVERLIDDAERSTRATERQLRSASEDALEIDEALSVRLRSGV